MSRVAGTIAIMASEPCCVELNRVHCVMSPMNNKLSRVPRLALRFGLGLAGTNLSTFESLYTC